MSTYAEKFNANIGLYKNVNITHIGLGTRAFNCVHQKGVRTLTELLGYSDEDILSLRGAGKLTIMDINKCIGNFIEKYRNEVPTFEEQVSHLSVNKMTVGQILHIESKYYAKVPIQSLQLDVRQEQRLIKAGYLSVYHLLNATPLELTKVEKIGKKLDCVLKKLSAYTQKKVDNKGISVDDTLRVKPFIRAYAKSNVFSTTNPLNSIDGDVTIKLISEKIPYGILSDQDRFEIDNFKEWLSVDLQDIVLDWETLPLKISKRSIGILNGRIKGSTLEEIGYAASCTRERVRQIEKSSLTRLVKEYNSQKYDLILYCSALRNGRKFITRNDIEKYLDKKCVDLVWYLIQERSQEIGEKYFEYSKLGDCVVIEEGAISFENKLSRILQRVSGGMHETDLKLLVIQTANLYGIPEDVIWVAIRNNFRQYGYVYSSKSMDRKDKVAYILKHYFLNGYKVSDKHDYDMMQDYFRTIFDDTKASTIHAVDTLVLRAGCLIGRGLYTHPDFVEASEDTLHFIFNYIDNSEVDKIFYGKMYDDLKNVLNDVGIGNRYYLKGVLDKYGCKYPSNRDFIFKHAGR